MFYVDTSRAILFRPICTGSLTVTSGAKISLSKLALGATSTLVLVLNNKIMFRWDEWTFITTLITRGQLTSNCETLLRFNSSHILELVALMPTWLYCRFVDIVSYYSLRSSLLKLRNEFTKNRIAIPCYNSNHLVLYNRLILITRHSILNL